MKLQSVELRVPDVPASAQFFENVWRLARVSGDGPVRLRGTEALPYLISLEQGAPAILSITFCGPKAEIGAEREVKGPEGERYRFVVQGHAVKEPAHPDRPIEL